MSTESANTPAGIFARIELLKKWQQEQQQKLHEQQSKQTEFLSNEHRRMYEALDLDASLSSTPQKDRNSERNESIDFASNSSDNTNDCDTPNIIPNKSANESFYMDVDKMPVKSSQVEFNVLLEESLKHQEKPIRNPNVKPKQNFLKRGSGLSRFRMTVNDLAHKKSKPVLKLRNKCGTSTSKALTNNIVPKTTTDIQQKSNKVESTYDLKAKHPVLCKTLSNSNKTNPKFRAPVSTTLRPKVTWTKPAQNIKNPEDSTQYQTLLTELVEARRLDPSVFDTPINGVAENGQKIFEQELLDELKVFELLEQKVSNSSFCSTSSLVTRLMEHSVKSTPKRALNFSSNIENESTLPTEEQFQNDIHPIKLSPKRSVTFASQAPNMCKIVYDEDEEHQFVSTETSDSESSDSSVNSDDVADTLKETPTVSPTYQWQRNKQKSKIHTYDAATNTDLPVINSELLKTRLEQLENEIDTFRTENARITKLKSELETESRNLDKRKRHLEKEIEEEHKKINAQLEEERSKIAKDRTVYDRYARELREGKALRKKERDEINVLRSQIESMSEEFKLKESRLSATQARLRNQLRQIEKENAALRIENNELQTKNAKLEITNKQFVSRRPSDTKVLHEINKNLTKLAQEKKLNISSPSGAESNEEITKRKSRSTNAKRKSEPRKSPIIFQDVIENNKENNKNSPNTIDISKSTTDNFVSIEREYEKMFGKLLGDEDHNVHKLSRMSESSSLDSSGRKEETVMEDGSIRITYPNGNVRTVSANEQLVTMRYHNGDVKETCRESGTIRYLHAGAQTWHTTFPDGLELLEFANGQTEKRFPNGASEIHFPNGSIRCTSPGGTEDVSFPDGTILVTRPKDGEKILSLPNGQREIHTNDHKRREYPDGTIKLLYPDGVQETRYTNGRIRLKDKDGNLIMDSAGA